MPSVVFRPATEQELQEAYNWYEEREAGLGSDFIRCIDASLQLISRHPEILPVAHKNIRQAVIRRFPYSIFYLSDKETIFVISVFHSSPQPRTWNRPKIAE